MTFATAEDETQTKAYLGAPYSLAQAMPHEFNADLMRVSPQRQSRRELHRHD